MTIGKGTKAGDELRAAIEDIEALNAQIKELQDMKSAIFAGLKAAGYVPKTVRAIIRMRATPKEERDGDSERLDVYMHAIGMADDRPLFAALGEAGADLAVREEAIDFLKTIVPPAGEIVLKSAGLPVRVWRDAEGVAHHADVDPDAPPPRTRSPRAAPEADADPEDDPWPLPHAPGGRGLTRAQIDAAVERAIQRRDAIAAAQEARRTEEGADA